MNYDKAMRGVHIDDAARRFGWLIETGVHAVKDRDAGAMTRHIEDQNIKLSDGRVIRTNVYTLKELPV